MPGRAKGIGETHSPAGVPQVAPAGQGGRAVILLLQRRGGNEASPWAGEEQRRVAAWVRRDAAARQDIGADALGGIVGGDGVGYPHQPRFGCAIGQDARKAGADHPNATAGAGGRLLRSAEFVPVREAAGVISRGCFAARSGLRRLSVPLVPARKPAGARLAARGRKSAGGRGLRPQARLWRCHAPSALPEGSQ